MRESKEMLLKGMVVLIIAVAFFGCLSMHTAYADTEDYGDADIIVEDIYPNIIYPGDMFDIYFRIINEGTDDITLKDVNITLPAGFEVISKDPLDVSRVLCGKCSLQMHYSLKTLPSIDVGKHTIEFNIITKDYTLKKEYLIEIQGDEDIFVSVLSAKGKINGDGEIELVLSNIGDVDLKDIKVYINDANIKIKNASFIYIPLLKKGEEKRIVIPVTLTKDVKEGKYHLNMNITYKGRKLNTNIYSISFNVLPNVELYVSSISLVERPIIGKSTDLVIRVENTGYGKAKNIRILLEGDVEMVQNEYYLGELESEEDSSAVFTITPLKRKSTLTYKIVYKEGDEEKSFEGTFTFNSFIESRTIFWIVIGIALVIVLLIVYKIYKHKKEEKE